MIKQKDKDLRILIINYEFPPLGGGGGIASYDLALEWAKKAKVDVLTSHFQDLPFFETIENINVHRVRILCRKSKDTATLISMLTFLPGAFLKGLALFRKNKYNIINTHFAIPSGPVGFILGKVFKTRNVLSLHGGDIYDPSKKLSPHRNFIFRIIVKFILNKADRIVAQSNNTRYNAIRYYKTLKDIIIIPLPFNPPDLSCISQSNTTIDAKDFTLITIGRIIKRKAIDIIIKALADIDNIKIRFLIIGDGPEKKNLQSLANELGVAKQVSFVGYLNNEDKYRLLSASDLFILTSLHEGFGIVFMEAMFCGLPIICTNNGGQTDFLKDEENAILIDVGDVRSCADAILRFYNDKALFKRCSENNTKKINNFYSANIAQRYTDIFYRLISGEKIDC
ncbi:MAG: glycosyltransferase family 4 protein [Spirochaetota bacterium]|nr:glycosyltransferase family 4 protein [Spirochaetota bacterium]